MILYNLSVNCFSQTEQDWPYKAGFERVPLIQTMDSLVQAGQFKDISSIVVAHKGQLVLEKYYNGATAQTLHNTRSATKTVTSALIGTLITNRQLASVEEPVAKYAGIKECLYPDERKWRITFEDLLTMSSVLECDDWNEWSSGNEERMYLIEDWVQFYWNLPIKGYPEWETAPKDSKYGRHFSYCTAGIVALGHAIHQLTGSLEAYADTALFAKLGIQNYHWQKTPTGLPMTGGGLGLRSRDLLKIAQLYLNKGVWNGRPLLTAEWVKQSLMPKAVVNALPNYEYGYLWWLSQFANQKACLMVGTGGNKIVLFPEIDLVVVLTSNYFNGGMKSHQQTDELLEKYIVPSIMNWVK